MKNQFLLLFMLLVMMVSSCAPEASVPKEVLEDAEQPEVPEQPKENIESNAVADNPVEPQEQPVKEVSVVEPVQLPEPVEEQAAENELQLFDPVSSLTYSGAYNGPLYATSEQIGNFPDKKSYMSNLKRNGVNFFIGMFTIFGKPSKETLVSHQGLGYVMDLVEKYPGMAVPFFGSGFGGEQLNPIVRDQGDTWVAMYTDVMDSYAPIVGEDFIKGFGEVETQEWSVRYTNPAIYKLIDVANENKKSFMFHPVASKLDDVKVIIERYPDTNFLIHMYREDLKNGQQKLITLMKTHDNLFFSIDAAHIIHYDENDILYSYYDEYGKNAKEKFMARVNSNHDSILNSAVAAYKPLVEAVPDKVMWGTEAGPAYSFDPEVYDLLIKVSREFIAKVTDDKDQQEALAYKNALRVFGPGVALNKEIKVINTDAWPMCNMADIDETCGYCGVSEDENDIRPEADACENACIVTMQCKDPLDDE